jgi:predicted ester cyclase
MSSATSMTPVENKTVVLRFLEALDRHDFASLAEHPGLKQILERHPMMRTAFPDLTHKVDEQIAEGDTVATRVTMTGTHLGPFMGVAATGRRMSWNILLMDVVVDGKIVLHHGNNSWTLLGQLGLLPPPPGPGTTITS